MVFFGTMNIKIVMIILSNQYNMSISIITAAVVVKTIMVIGLIYIFIKDLFYILQLF